MKAIRTLLRKLAGPDQAPPPPTPQDRLAAQLRAVLGRELPYGLSLTISPCCCPWRCGGAMWSAHAVGMSEIEVARFVTRAEESDEQVLAKLDQAVAKLAGDGKEFVFQVGKAGSDGASALKP